MQVTIGLNMLACMQAFSINVFMTRVCKNGRGTIKALQLLGLGTSRALQPHVKLPSAASSLNSLVVCGCLVFKEVTT